MSGGLFGGLGHRSCPWSTHVHAACILELCSTSFFVNACWQFLGLTALDHAIDHRPLLGEVFKPRSLARPVTHDGFLSFAPGFGVARTRAFCGVLVGAVQELVNPVDARRCLAVFMQPLLHLKLGSEIVEPLPRLELEVVCSSFIRRP